MIQKESVMPVLDNSGAKRALCIRTLNRNVKGFAYVGDLLVVTIKYAIIKKLKKKKKMLKKGEIYKALLLNCRKAFMRLSGHRIGGVSNGIIILRKDNITMPYGNRLRSPIFREVRDEFSKIYLMSLDIL